jgi:hypothetical protein
MRTAHTGGFYILYEWRSLMDDQQFLEAFEAAQLHPFRHADHIRIAWLYLRRDGWEIGYRHISDGLRHFAESHGAYQKYHETITRFWAYVVNYAISLSEDIDDFDAFSAHYPHLFDGRIIFKHYSEAITQSATARNQWVEPDLFPLPATAFGHE